MTRKARRRPRGTQSGFVRDMGARFWKPGHCRARFGGRSGWERAPGGPFSRKGRSGRGGGPVRDRSADAQDWARVGQGWWGQASAMSVMETYASDRSFSTRNAVRSDAPDPGLGYRTRAPAVRAPKDRPTRCRCLLLTPNEQRFDHPESAVMTSYGSNRPHQSRNTMIGHTRLMQPSRSMTIAGGLNRHSTASMTPSILVGFPCRQSLQAGCVGIDIDRSCADRS